MRRAVLALLAAVILFRLVGLILGCFYGPYVYIVLPVGGLYLTFDCLVAYVVFAGAEDSAEGDPVAGNERGFRIAWIAFNVLAAIGLLAAIILFLVELGFWSMAYYPIHVVIFVVILILLIAIAATMAVMAMGMKGGRKGNYAGVRNY